MADNNNVRSQPQVHVVETVTRLRASADSMAAAAMRRLNDELPWYRGLTAEEKSWLRLLVQTGISSFIEWYQNTDHSLRSAVDIFDAAPPELTRSITLQSTLQLIRTIVDIVEDNVPKLAPDGQERMLQEAVLKYSREIAFTAAEVYARAAEIRGAWDSRLEALVVDAIMRGDATDSLRSRIAALGWSGDGQTVVVIGMAPNGGSEDSATQLRRIARRAASDALVSVHGDRLVLVLGGSSDVRTLVTSMRDEFGPGPIVIGPSVPALEEAGRSALEALAGIAAAHGWASAPTPVLADELLPERALIGDTLAKRQLVDHVFTPLQEAGAPFLETLVAYLDHGRSLEATARALFVHPNTVRYRLKRIAEITGWDATDARESYVLHISMSLGLLDIPTSTVTTNPDTSSTEL